MNMAPDSRITVREDSSYNYNVFDGDRWLASFKMFADAAEFAAKQTILKEEHPECEYCHGKHNPRLACPAYAALLAPD